MWEGGGGPVLRVRLVGAIQTVDLDRRSGSIEMGVARCIRELAHLLALGVGSLKLFKLDLWQCRRRCRRACVYR